MKRLKGAYEEMKETAGNRERDILDVVKKLEEENRKYKLVEGEKEFQEGRIDKSKAEADEPRKIQISCTERTSVWLEMSMKPVI